jgi:large subunit ribosomal protein L17
VRHRHGGRKLGRPTGHRLALLRNLVTDLLRYERVRTTEAKAAELQREAEKIIGKAREGTLHARRQVLAYVYDPKVVAKLFSELRSRYQDRSGGFTRRTKLGFRRGDGAPLAQVELVD